MNCRHWSPCRVAGGGCCALNRYGGRPSLGVCGRCPVRSPPFIRGLGDLLERLLEKLRLAALLKRAIADIRRHNAWLRPDDAPPLPADDAEACGCPHRRDGLNKIVPFPSRES